MMNRKTKKRMLVMSLMFLALGATVTLASSNDVLKVQTMLNSAIQDIQKIYFSSGAVKDLTHPEYEIPVLVQNGSVSMGGRMLMTTSGAKNILTKESTGSSLFQGRNNILSGVDSYILAGSGNRIYQNVTGSVIIGGTNNTINQGKNLYILGGSGNKIWQGNNSFIIGGKNVQITGDNSYVFMGNGTNQGKSVKVNANHVVTFGKNVEIDKDYVFLWRDHSTTDKKTAEKENTFIMFAKNGLHILKNNSTSKAVFVTTGALKVEGSVQLSGEEVKCGKSIQGAIQYTGGTNGCFCGCNGSSWVSLLPTENCRNLCPKISGRSYEDGKCIAVPNGGFESLYNDASSCSEGEISGYNQVNDPSGFPMKWTWECIGDNGTIASCSGDAKREEGKCFSGAGATGKGSEFTCFKGKPTNQQTNGHKYTWDCLPINKPTNYPNTPKQNRKSCTACDQENGYVRNSTIQDCVLAQDTSCDNATQFGCTNGGNPVSQGTIEGGNTWDCESPTGGNGENNCHWCNESSNYVRSGGACVLKKRGECRTDFTGSPAFSTTSSVDNNRCNVGKRIEFSQNGDTYKWKCEGENAGGDTAWNSDLCHYCPTGTIWNGGNCVAASSDCQGELPYGDHVKLGGSRNPGYTWQNTDYGHENDYYCLWSCEVGWGKAADGNYCVKIPSTQEPICQTLQGITNGNPTNNVCDSASEMLNWHLPSPFYSNTTQGRESEDGCGEQAYTWKCKNTESGIEKFCFSKRTDMNYFNITYTPNNSSGLEGTFIITANEYPGNKGVKIRLTAQDGRNCETSVGFHPDGPNTIYLYRNESAVPVGGNKIWDCTNSAYPITKVEFVEVVNDNSLVFEKERNGNKNCPSNINGGVIYSGMIYYGM